MLLSNKIINWNILNISEKKQLLLRPKIVQSSDLKESIRVIINNVKNFGDQALYQYTKKFDKVDLSCFQVSKKRIESSSCYINKQLKNAIIIAKKNIQLFHINQKMPCIDINTQVGIRCQQVTLPIESVGLYVPAGSAPLLSTALMLAVPAVIAGCKNIVLCSPPPINNEILYIAKICNIYNVFEIGGAQAIAALGFGTATIPKVNKIFGPGNIYVTEAKIQLNQLLSGLSIDMIAGPSELFIIADKTANPDFIAADVLSQAEHGIDSQVIVASNDISLLQQVLLKLQKQLLSLSRSNIILQSLKNSKFIFTSSLLECVDISNQYAPEHLIIQTENSRNLLDYVINAGSVFLGHWSPESVGDYASGTNHVLPTNGNTISTSGLSVLDFQKKITIQELTPFGLKNITQTVKTLALSEHMDGHANAVIIRANAIKEKYGK
ncbi:histidinol dehydrogenase [Buchnera aphidicola]|uniref:Histidinol dehydrogenase n=1 Tax=Buchnera aphidicola (Sarucallis kahawaluokalani) TaxID=1241878 RepID=A0A4D6Y7I8_9GAMM|nr:histidinol dehydrogenase [Buchnera aphidicola]QCI25876.1 histidinol dehydrogenase [Buchnera aphidicola (Sarucallis kahawaluokalani)]